MRNWITSIKYLYREVIVYNLAFTAITINLFIQYGTSSYSYVFWLKVIGYGFTGLVYYWNRKKYLYFFHNLSLNRRDLVASVLITDVLITLAILSTINVLL